MINSKAIALVTTAACAAAVVFAVAPALSIPASTDSTMQAVEYSQQSAGDSSGASAEANVPDSDDAVADDDVKAGASDDAANDSDRQLVEDGQEPDAVPAAETASAQQEEFEQGTVLVGLAEGVTADQAMEAFGRDENLSGLTLEKQTSRYVKFGLPDGLSVDDAIELLQHTGMVQNAQPNYYFHISDDIPATTADASSATDQTARATTASASDQSVAASATSAATGQSTRATAAPASSTGTLALAGGGATSATIAAAPLATTLPNAVLQSIAAPNDPEYSEQWALESINAPDAWNTLNGRGITSPNPVVIAIIDDEFFLSHSDFSSTDLVKPYDASTGKASTSLSVGSSNHGTHVMGIISASTNNGKGVASVTYNNCKVMPVKLKGSDGNITLESLSTAYDYVIAQRKAGVNVCVANCSLALNNKEGVKITDPFLYQLIDDAYKAGIVTVAAACNAGGTLPDEPPFYAYPSDYDSVVSVMNLESDSTVDDQVLRYESTSGSSNYNVAGQKAKDISAPGTDILSTTNRDDKYITKTGTSMSAPVVSAVLGLIFTMNPDMTPDEATSKLFSTARDLTSSTYTEEGWDEGSGYGEADAAAAVAANPYISGSAVLYTGGTQAYSAKIDSKVQSGFTWSSSDPAILAIDATTGEATAKGPGEVILTAKKGNSIAQQTVTSYGIAGNQVISAGVEADYEVGPQHVKAWEWSVSDESVATIDKSTGHLTTLKPGALTVMATSGPYKLSKDVNVISGDFSESNKGIVATIKDVTYTGSPLTPIPTVTDNGQPLTYKTHFDVEWKNNLNAGTGIAVITGIGYFTGSRTITFTIKKAPIKTANVSLSDTKLEYNEKAQAPEVSVGDIGQNSSKSLSPGSDYTTTKKSVVIAKGSVVVKATSVCQNFTGTTVKKFSVVAKSKPVYRLYNKYTGEHFYTQSAKERAKLKKLGWKYEGVAWKAPEFSKKPVYRLYNPSTGDHHYTKSKTERKKLRRAGWRNEGIAWYASSSKSAPVYRLYNKHAQTGAHLFTTSKKERNKLKKLGWKKEGTAFYVALA